MGRLEMKYFVLKPTSGDPAHREASRSAIRAYAAAIQNAQPQFSRDLFAWVERLDQEDMNLGL